LARLRLEAESVKDEGGTSFCANKIWYIKFDRRLAELIGQDAHKDDPLLRSRNAHELAYETLYKLLPDCRSCICLPW
jgi:hypothetical protein